MADLAHQCGESYSTVSRGIRKLASPGDPGALAPAYGLVELLSDADDRRASMPIGPLGLIELGNTLLALGRGLGGA